MNVQDAYSNWSATYDADHNLTRDLDQRATRETLADQRYDSILEIGCGTGKNTAFLAGLARRVYAIDFSAGMLEKARKKIQSSHVTFLAADLTKPWPCDAQSVELVVCNLVLEHIEDLTFIFSETVRTLQVGGCFFVCELHPFRQYQGKQANFQRGEETIKIPVFLHHLSDFTEAAEQNGLSLVQFREWWHEDDKTEVPRLVSFLFEKKT